MIKKWAWNWFFKVRYAVFGYALSAFRMSETLKAMRFTTLIFYLASQFDRSAGKEVACQMCKCAPSSVKAWALFSRRESKLHYRGPQSCVSTDISQARSTGLGGPPRASLECFSEAFTAFSPWTLEPVSQHTCSIAQAGDQWAAREDRWRGRLAETPLERLMVLWLLSAAEDTLDSGRNAG